MPEPTNSPTGQNDESPKLKVIEEVAEVGVVQTITGRVTARTVTETENIILGQNLNQTEVDIVRKPIGSVIKDGDPMPAIRTEGDVTIIPVFEEKAVVTTQLVLTEELHITRRTTTRQIEIPVALRRQRVVLDQSGPPDAITANINPSEGL